MSRADDLRLVHLETSGNQAFIFGTNRLKENVGASERTYRAGTEQAAQAVNRVFFDGREVVPFDAGDPEVLARWLEDQPRIEDDGGQDVEVLVGTSGKALVLVRGEERARRLVHAWTTDVAVNAPGVDAQGVYSDPLALGQLQDGLPAAAAAVRQVHRRFEQARALRPSPLARFPRLPVVAACDTSGLPAGRVLVGGQGEVEHLSEVSAVKRHIVRRPGGARDRFQALLPGLRVPEHLEEMLDAWSLDWLGVIHADGNGLGKLFLRLHEALPGADGERVDRAYLDAYRSLSLGLDRLTRQAFQRAAEEVFTQDRTVETAEAKAEPLLPVLPIVVGGDDLTVVCDGRRALPFARRFLEIFEKEVAHLPQDSPLGQLFRRAFGVQRLGMSAGVALVKPGFPFFSAYSLAEELLQSAKEVKDRVSHGGASLPASALDYHLTLDSSIIDLATARRRLEVGDRYRLHGRPYVVTPLERLAEDDVDDLAWAEAHSIAELENARESLSRTRPGTNRRLFPASQAHRLRAALHGDPARAAVLFDRLLRRYEREGFSWPGALWVEDPLEEGRELTRFQDALEILEFLPQASAPVEAEGGGG